MSARRAWSRRAFAAAVAVVVALPSLAQDPRASLAQRAARDWLALTDKLDAKAAWDAAGRQFRQSMEFATWDSALHQQRGARGDVKQRALVHTELRADIPDRPLGEYALVVFRTEFANADGQESVTVEREADGIWRVIGYVIR